MITGYKSSPIDEGKEKFLKLFKERVTLWISEEQSGLLLRKEPKECSEIWSIVMLFAGIKQQLEWEISVVLIMEIFGEPELHL
jgi:hypothetical protein